MNIGNITSDNFNLDGNGKDIQIEGSDSNE